MSGVDKRRYIRHNLRLSEPGTGKRIKLTRLGIVVLIGFLAIGGVGAYYGISYLSSLSTQNPLIIAGTPQNFVAVDVANSNAGMKLTVTVDGTPHDVDVTPEQAANWADTPSTAYPAGKHAPIQAYCSRAWLSDSSGHQLPQGYAPPYVEVFAPTFGGFSVAGDVVNASEAVFRYLVYYTVEVVIRTGPVIPMTGFNIQKHYLTPLAGTKAQGGTTWYAFMADVTMVPAAEVEGALTMFDWRGTVGDYTIGDYSPLYGYTGNWNPPPAIRWQTNTMDTPHVTGRIAPYTATPGADPGYTGSYPDSGDRKKAYVTPLVPVSFQYADGDNYDSTLDPILDPTSTNSRVMSKMPVASSDVTVRIAINGNSESIRGEVKDVPLRLNDGSTVYVNSQTVSAVVGFSGFDTNVNGITGLLKTYQPYIAPVPNINPAHDIPTFDLSNPTAGQTTSSQTMLVSETNPQGDVQYLSGKVQVGGVTVAVAQTGGATIGVPTVNVTARAPIIADLENNCNIPKNIGITDTTTITPMVRIGTAYGSVNWQRAVQKTDQDVLGFHLKNGWYVYSGSANIQWPYAASVNNWCYVRNYTVPVDVISERNYQTFDGNGHPIPISSIVDKAINSIYTDPRLSNLQVTQKGPNLNDPCNRTVSLLDVNSWFAPLECWFNKWSWAVIAIIAGALFLYVLSLVNKAQAQYEQIQSGRTLRAISKTLQRQEERETGKKPKRSIWARITGKKD